MEHKFFTQILKYVLISTALDCFFFVKAFIRILIKIFRHISGVRIVYRGGKDLEFFSLLKVVPGKKMWKTLFLFIKAFRFRIKIWLRSIENRLRCIFFSHESFWEIVLNRASLWNLYFPQSMSAFHWNYWSSF